MRNENLLHYLKTTSDAVAALTAYDSGSESTTTAFLGEDVTPDSPCKQLLIYVTADSLAKFNESAKEVFLPADVWTPIGFIVDNFNVKTIEGEGVAYWQGWF